jgi:ornithine--oxo-acid transaminase
VDHDDVKPDLVVLGKALSGGTFPVSCVLGTHEVILCGWVWVGVGVGGVGVYSERERERERERVHTQSRSHSQVILGIKPGEHGSTFGGNPLACKIAMASLDVIKEENLCENAEKMGQLTRKNLLSMKSPLGTHTHTHTFLKVNILVHLCWAVTRY